MLPIATTVAISQYSGIGCVKLGHWVASARKRVRHVGLVCAIRTPCGGCSPRIWYPYQVVVWDQVDLQQIAFSVLCSEYGSSILALTSDM